MKKKYKRALIIITILFFFTLSISTGYGLWKTLKDSNPVDTSKVLNCFKMYYSSNNDTISLSNIKPILNEDGNETSPYTITVTNICSEEKNLQIRLNILDDNTIDLKALTLTASGNLESGIITYNSLRNAKTNNQLVKISKTLGTITIKSKETIRTNIRLWFDEKQVNSISPEDTFRAQFELIDMSTQTKPTFAESILLNNEVIDGSELNYGEAAVAGGLYKVLIDNNDYYFFRGAVTNNYVTFANKMWRIVGINTNQSVKLVLDTSAGTSQYSTYKNAMDYTGIKYIYNNNLVDNQINKFLLEWYKNNIEAKGYDKKVQDNDFCNDSFNINENYHRYFAGYNRLISAKTPTPICNNTTEDFGGTITQKVGLLTADEVAMAGGVDNVNNTAYYLYQAFDYFTMTPAEYYGYNAYVFYVNGGGSLLRTTTTDNHHVRPVININSSLSVDGLGTIDNPYTIDEN